MLLSNTSGTKHFLSTANDLLIKNEKTNILFYNYYEGNQWYISGITTMSGMPAIDKRKKNKNYSGVVVNLIKDCVDTVKNLSSGVSGISNNIYDELNINFESFHDNLLENVLLYGNAYVKLYKDFDGNISLSVLNNLLTIHNYEILKNENGEEYKYDEYVLYTIKSENEYHQKKYNYTIYTIDYIREYNEDGILVYEKPNELNFIPIFEIDGNRSYVKDLIQTQDMLNISLTQELEINKYSGDPLTVGTGISGVDTYGKAITNDSVNLGSGEIILLGEGADVKRIDSKGVSQEFLTSLERYKKDLYKMGKLGSLKNDDLSGVTSGYALQLKLLDTLSFIKKLRGTIKLGMNKMFGSLKEYTGKDLFFEYSQIIPVSNIDLIEEGKGYKELGFSFDFIASKIGLTEEEIVEEKINQEKENTLNILKNGNLV